MSLIGIIMGILLIIGGVSCIATPLATFLSTGYLIGASFLVYGIAGLIRNVQLRARALEIVVDVLAIIVGIISFIRPGATLVFDGMLLYCIAAWFLVQGISSIVFAFEIKPVIGGWYWVLISGILGVLLGIYSFAHPMVTALTAGILIGFYFIESGVSMIALGCMLID